MRTRVLGLGTLLLIACGSGGGGSDGGDSGSVGDGGGSDGRGGDAGTIKTRYFANITLSTGSVSAGMQKTELYYASAAFNDTTKLVPLLDCPPAQQDGACATTVCTRTDASAMPEAGVASVPAGNVTITAGKTLVLMPAASYIDNGQGLLWTGGQDVGVKVDGASMGAPAFQDTLKAPSFVTVTAPTFVANQPIVADRTQPLAVAWTGGSVGDVRVTLVSATAGVSTVVVCTFPSSAGSGTVPVSSLGKLPPTTMGGLTINGAVTRQQVVGEWTFMTDATSSANTPAGGYAAATLTVQ